MTTETDADPRENFVPRLLPWLLAAAALAVYLLTLNHWVSLMNLGPVAKISGWTWQSESTNPLLFLVTYPFRWLPAAQVPLALNVFSAVCGAATLGLLARSVAVLPHDRTEGERRRERSDFSFLTTGSAWLPPVLAVAVCGLQLTFWEHATNFAGEAFDLLLFVFVIWSLLEFRLDGREGRLYLAAFVWGAGMTEDWALIGFLPLFIATLIWIRGFDFFDFRFLKWMVLCGLAGMLFYLLLPLLSVLSPKTPLTFWQMLKLNLISQKYVFFAFPRDLTELSLLILPAAVFIMAIRWSSTFGDSSRMGSSLAKVMVYLMYAFLLIICLWIAYDPSFSPRQKGLGLPFLTFYYLGALCVGYYSGSFLLIFGKALSSRSKSPSYPPSPSEQFLNLCGLMGIVVLATIAVVGLVYRNLPIIREFNADTIGQYGALVDSVLPPSGGILLCDSDDPNQDIPLHLFMVQAALARDGRSKEFVPVATKSLIWPGYHRFLHRQFPERWPDLVPADQTGWLNPLGILGFLNVLSKTNDLYYLHPSFGLYFEQFYQEPHGLVYRLKPLSPDTLLPPAPDEKVIAENQNFWSNAETGLLAAMERTLAPTDPNAPESLGQQVLRRLHVPRERNPVAFLLGPYCSRSLDFWGVQLQRAGKLPEASACFITARKLNPDNVVAQINLQFNAALRAGGTVPVDPASATPDRFGNYHDWLEVLGANGPFDEPSFCFAIGLLYAQNAYVRQAMAEFHRVCQVDPDYVPARRLLARVELQCHLPDRALEVLQAPLTQPEKFLLTESESIDLNILAAGAYFQKTNFAAAEHLLQAEIESHPTNNDLLIAVVQAYITRGLLSNAQELMNRRPDDNRLLLAAVQACTAYGYLTNALEIIDRKLKKTPDDPGWLVGRGNLLIQLHEYAPAIETLNHAVAVQTNNVEGLLNRAFAYFQTGQLDLARADLQRLQPGATNQLQAVIGYYLGEIAWRQQNTNEAVKNYKIYLASANTNSTEARAVLEKLAQAKGK
jgi:tetratricopeptide (TPR) repeat protein